ncbi:MAG: NapC/NirT family cytochrome c [Steroidobacteraceae bacterium]|jgi:nitrate/TMAO reductase-like tetraheme cytochrome c subunit|nr:NapC/NirT family cytochrome c [Steroidobacteraceae bacterium]
MIKHFFAAITGNIVSLIGTLLIVISLLLIGTLLVMQSLGFEGGAYLGVLTFVVLPMAFLMGLVLVPAGLWWRKRRDARLSAEGKESGHLPVFDLNQERTRAVLITFFALGIPVLALAAGLTFKAVHYMDSDEFCGMACHKVMQPEYTAFQRSPHLRVGCAGCHIGPGAEWFVKAKISGAWQLVAVAFDLYPRPIPTPVHSLRPANGTCEQCHWPTKFVGERLKVRTHYKEDEPNTEVKTALMVKVGGQLGGKSSGIHWHVDPDNEVRYRADRTREIMYEVQLVDRTTGETKLFKGEEEAPADAEWRTMDCVDCHNRASHTYRSPEYEVDLALEEGRIDRGLPYIRREGVRILTEKVYESHDEARAGIAAAVKAFYSDNYPDLAGSPAVEQAGLALGDAYCWNNFPHMKVTWNLYPNHIGHEESPGCFRCHSNKIKTDSGDKIGRKCSTCHEIVAEEESDSKLLQELGVQQPPPEPAAAEAPAGT